VSDIAVLRAGPLTTIQDLGRPGWAHIGVPPSGAADPDALRFGNRIVGNDPTAAALEVTLAGPRLRFHIPAGLALTGAEANATLAGRPAAPGALLQVRAGDLLELRGCVRGVRTYICIRGGIDVEPSLGSRSTDLFSGVGPAPLRDGDLLRIGADPPTPAPPSVDPPPPRPGVPLLRVVAGPREDWFVPGTLAALCAATWRVNPASNRVGLRLSGPRLQRLDRGELLSEGVVTGALQVPPSGQPILLLNDHPTTGGYPVLAAVCAADVALTGQLGPGSFLRFALAE
jgi:biotin-dependent carboxylase-like uncharacterized protein